MRELGFDERVAREARGIPSIGDGSFVGRVRRIDRGWSTYLCTTLERVDAAVQLDERRVRNIGADVAVGDWIVVSDDGERIVAVLPRRSRLVRRASSDDDRAVPQTIAANVDVILLVHGLDVPTNLRRLERELVLAFDSGARPVVVLTKSDTTTPEHVERTSREVVGTALGVAVHVVSGATGEGLDALRDHVRDGATAVVLGASGAGKSTLINALTGVDSQATGRVRAGDGRGRHTTTAVDLVRLGERGWLIDTPGVRTVGLWTSGHGIERAFADVFGYAEACRFRDCKHEHEPSCAVLAAIESGRLDRGRLAAMRRLVAEEAALEAEQNRAQKRR